ncbi:MAG: transcriptional regulator of acetoin/glycerol metabolism [Rhodococcus sp. (in: high G+C Gram-positive bacteria)]|jgi:transcriptional regulator of acetoin/glycerol metabolism
MYGLDPDRCAPRHTPSPTTSLQLRIAADRVVEHRRAALSQSSSSLAVTDSQGRILNRWVEDDGFAHLLDSQLVSPEYSVAEATTGTTSGGIVLETGEPTMVAGPEHFYGNWLGFTCAGAPIRHPISRRLIGSINLTVRFSDTSPVLLSWVTDIATEIERALLETASRRERVLLDAFLGARRDPRHPVLCLDEQTVISNASAARLLSTVDKAMLWEHASARLDKDMTTSSRVTLESGIALAVEVSEVSESGNSVGALIRLQELKVPAAHRDPSTIDAKTLSLSGLVGMTQPWKTLCAGVNLCRARSLLLTGDSGVGKHAVALVVAGSEAISLDASEFTGVKGSWLAAVAEARGSVLILRRIDALHPSLARDTARLLDQDSHCRERVFGTATNLGDINGSNPLVDWFEASIEVPNLAQRMEDLRLLLDALTRRYVSNARAVRWTPHAVQTLSRVRWPRNIASLDTLVREILQANHKPTVEVSDIPGHVRARASRRALVGLEQVEAKAILQAMRDANGNKSIAADTLGIARSTLYRKVRSLGIDLSVSNY